MPRFPLLALVALLVSACSHVSPQRPQPFAQFDRSAPDVLRETGTPGAVIAVVRGDEIVYAKAFGLANAEFGLPMRTDTTFRIASLTKSFTGLASAIAAERGTLALDAPIGRYASELPPRLATLTLAQLLSHSAGMRDEGAGYGPRDPKALAAAARRLTDADLFTTPGDIYSYSNLGFTLAGFILESAAQKPYAEVVQNEILTSLGMKQSTFDSAIAMTFPLAAGHAPGEKPTVVRPYWDSGEALARGGMFSTAPDLARFAIAIMNGGVIDGAQAISKNAIDTATAAHVAIPGQRANESYGYGFRIGAYRGTKQVAHFGGGMGFGAVVRMLPEKKVAVIVLANRTNALLNQLADAALDEAAFGDRSTASTSTEAIPEDVPIAAGRYQNGAQVLEIVSRDGVSYLKDEETLFPLRRTGIDEVQAINEQGEEVLRIVLVRDYLFTFGRAFRRE